MRINTREDSSMGAWVSMAEVMIIPYRTNAVWLKMTDSFNMNDGHT